MVHSNTFLIKKKDSFIHKKRFSDRIILNHLHRNLKSPLIGDLNLPYNIATSNVLTIKTSIYGLQKQFKAHRSTALDFMKECSMDKLNNFSFKLQISGFYISAAELEKERRLKDLRLKLSQFFFSCLIKKYKPNYQRCPMWRREYQLYLDIVKPEKGEQLEKTFSSKIKKQYITFSYKLGLPKFRSLGLQRKQQDKININFSIMRKNYSRVLESRIFAFFNTYKKRYKLVSMRNKYNKIRLKKVLIFLKNVPKRFEKVKRYYHKKYKALVWKRKKRKNRKKTGLLGFLRRRKRRLLFQFFVPRHFEINYKTFELVHLGEFDLNTTNSRIPYWLNLRRLLTFLFR